MSTTRYYLVEQTPGEVSPDCTIRNTDDSVGTFDDLPYWSWTNDSDTWYLYRSQIVSGWDISNILPFTGDTAIWRSSTNSIIGTYEPVGGMGGSGNIIVGEVGTPDWWWTTPIRNFSWTIED